MKQVSWTNKDFLEGLCKVGDIGKTREQLPEVQTPEEVVKDLPPASMQELKQAALRVARGATDDYEAFLKANPGFHQKFLLAMVKEPPPPVKPELTVHISWLTPDRLSYKSGPALELVQETPRAESPKPWLPETEKQKGDRLFTETIQSLEAVKKV